MKVRIAGQAHSGDALIATANRRMMDIVALAERAAVCDGRVLITGESGVGKGVIARHIHAHSARSPHAFATVNCAGIAESLLESELFGPDKESAQRDKPGKLEAAHRGTLFLDEVSEMTLRTQASLLRFLEDGEIQPAGSDASGARLDVRIVAATNRDLGEMVAAGQFRDDLLYRLRVIHLEVPPLRERPDDIRPLVAHFIERCGRPVTVSEEASKLLERYRWPGNVRELQSVIEQAVWMTPGGVIKVEHLPPAIQAATETMLPVRERRRQVADELYGALVTSGYLFWDHVYPLFLSRDITRHDIRELVRRGLATTRGNYRALLTLFGMSKADYKRFLNFLASHDCRPDFREFRNGVPPVRRPAPPVLPPLNIINQGSAIRNQESGISHEQSAISDHQVRLIADC